MTLPSSALILCILFSCFNEATSQQRFGVAIGNDNNVAPDVVRRDHYEYHHEPPQGAHPQRQAGPFEGILPGLIVTIASSVLQWWNEGRAVRNARMVASAKRNVVELETDAPIDAKNDGKLVHITGTISTESGLTDPDHGLHRPDALKLIRTSEEYQWKEQRSETRTRVSERETRVEVEYRYFKKWSKTYVDSNRFESPRGHNNPHPKYRLGREKFTASNARISSNGLRLGKELIDQIDGRNIPFELPSVKLLSIESNGPVPVVLRNVNGKDLAYNDDATIISSDNSLYFSQRKTPSDLLALDGPSNKPNRKVPDNNQNVVIRSMPAPEVGDIRVSWDEVTAPPHGASILAMQKDDQLVPWVYDDKGRSIYTLFPGQFTAKSMIEVHVHDNKVLAKVFRIVGLIGSFLGFNLILSCVPALVNLLPFGVGSLLEPLANIASATLALSASVGLSAAVIAVAWLRFRPLLSTGLLLISGGGLAGPYFYARWKRSTEVKMMDSRLLSDETDELAHLT